MFEQSLVESRVRAVPARVRWTTIVSVASQGAVASLLVALPLLHPESLSLRPEEMKVMLTAPAAPPPPPRIVTQQAATQQAADAMASAVPTVGRMATAPRIVPMGVDRAPEQAPMMPGTLRMDGGGVPGALTGDGTVARVRVAPAGGEKPGPVHVSSGVSAGLLLSPIRPVYPSIAKAAHVEGTVVVEAVISKTGTIESLRVVSGPAMLQAAAVEATRAARYRPFRLNDEPVEVQTTITVNFRMGG